MNCDECGENVPDNLRLCPDCAIPKHSKASSSLAPARGSTAPDQHAQEFGEAFKTMEEEQWEDYQEYIRMTRGTGKSAIKASRPVRSNAGAEPPATPKL
jgi:ribosome-binding protein aMBF1 (putative translation factor)